MLKALAIACAGMFLACLMLLACTLIAARRRRELENEIEDLDRRIRSLNARNAELERTLEMKERIGNETKQKIDALHDGDALGNAVGILSKRKGQS